jgi:hypothetical protein
MPTKQTREAIEAELDASELERLERLTQELIQDHEEFERNLRLREEILGLPAFYSSKPTAERMAAVGMSQAAIDQRQIWVDAIRIILSGRSYQLPDHVKNKLAAEADAQFVGAKLLADIVQKPPEGMADPPRRFSSRRPIK